MADNTATFKIEIEVDPGNAQATVGNLTGELRKMSGLDGMADKIDKGFQQVDKSAQKTTQSLSTTRYALYDVSQTLGVAGAAMVGLAGVTSGVAIAFERDFANVIRTVGSEIGYTSPLIDELRTKLVDLSTTIPVSFRELTEIATLGGQLGIAATGIDEFTEVVAKLGATTDLTFEQAGTAIGRFAAILGVPEEEFNNLASAILKVGVNSVATESQIVNISTQISSMAAYAGLTAEQVVGLAGALASVGAQPELSRGTITRTFTEMSEAITAGGDSLEGFASIAGVSSEEFRSAFGTSRFAAIFQKFIGGLGDMQRNGEDANAAIRQLGITSVRDVPLLLRLGLAQDTVNAAFADGASGYRDGTELTAQYGVIAETTASQLQVLANSFQALLDAIGSNTLGPLSSAIELLTGFFNVLTDVASNDFLGPFLGLGVVLTAIAGALTLAGAGIAAFGASSIAMRQGLMGIVAIAPGASAAILGTGTASAIAAGEMRAATIGAKAFGIALKALSIIGLVLVLPDIADFFDEGIRGIQGLTNEFEDMKGRFLDTDLFFGADIAQYDASFAAVGRALGDIANRGFGDIRRMDEELAALANSGNAKAVREEYESLRDIFVNERGGSIEAFEALFADTKAALSGTAPAAAEAAAGIDEIALAAEEAEADLKALREAILQFGATSISVEATQIALSEAWNNMTAAAEAADVTLTGTNETSLKYRSSLLDIDKAARDAAVALVENGASAEQATEKYEEGRRALIDSIAAKTGDMEAARLWADQVLGTSGEAAFAIAQYAAAYNQVPKEVRTTIFADTGPAMGEVGRLISNINGQVAYISIRATDETGNVLNRATPRGTVSAYASGGHITGPGTGTSDSIPAWLSNGEYVIKAASVQRYGTAFMNALNSGRVPKFASGGPVGGSSSPGMMGGVVELGPKSLARLSREVVNTIAIDQRSIARAANAGNSQNSWKGGLG